MDELTVIPEAAPRDGSPGIDLESLTEILILLVVVGAALFGGAAVGLGFFGPAAVILGVGVATVMLHRRGQSWVTVGMGLRRNWWITIGGAIGGTVILIIVSVVVTSILQAIGVGQPDTSALNFVRETWWGLPLMLTIGWTTAAFGEEMLFRGFLMTRLAKGLGGGRIAMGVALIVQAGLFGLAHSYQGIPGMIAVSMIGFTVGVLYYVFRRNLWIPILAHGLLDTVGLTALYFNVGA